MSVHKLLLVSEIKIKFCFDKNLLGQRLNSYFDINLDTVWVVVLTAIWTSFGWLFC